MSLDGGRKVMEKVETESAHREGAGFEPQCRQAILSHCASCRNVNCYYPNKLIQSIYFPSNVQIEFKMLHLFFVHVFQVSQTTTAINNRLMQNKHYVYYSYTITLNRNVKVYTMMQQHTASVL